MEILNFVFWVIRTKLPVTSIRFLYNRVTNKQVEYSGAEIKSSHMDIKYVYGALLVTLRDDTPHAAVHWPPYL